jgi:Icc-related predicted phosphoesterase
MKVLIIADDQTAVWQLSSEPADLVLSCGDLLDPAILRAKAVSGAAEALAVKGNHDPDGPFCEPIRDIHLQTFEFGGVTFGGFEGAWRYKPCGHFLYDQEEAERLLAAFPPVDVFVAHNSPRGIHDRDDEVHVGFDAFRSYILRARPMLFIHGHQHANVHSFVGDTAVIGVYGCRRIQVQKRA